ncbi:hypothetical protein [Thalassolituus sp. UBA3500]|uniref:hypothetical protein n=1 Tax=Thalassolituus sp. UBA3500 TaxID=1947664 RepID=UPI00263ACF88|nr:hypothetical protein [Thalassolituus sp. UBA3500]
MDNSVLQNSRTIMPSIIKCFTLATLATLAACGGGGGGDSEPKEEELTLEELSVVCTDADTVDVDGIELQMDVVDSNHDGCLSDFEYRVAERMAAAIAVQLEIDGTNNSSDTSTVKSLMINGNSEVSDGKAQLHTNLESGEFSIHIKSYSNNSSTETLRVYFDDESAAGKSGEEPPYTMDFSLVPVNGNFSYGITCRYSSGFSITCTNVIILPEGDIVEGTTYYTQEVVRYFPLSLTFAEESLPQGGYIIATFCEDGDEETEATCLENYAEVPVSFN